MRMSVRFRRYIMQASRIHIYVFLLQIHHLAIVAPLCCVMLGVQKLRFDQTLKYKSTSEFPEADEGRNLQAATRTSRKTIDMICGWSSYYVPFILQLALSILTRKVSKIKKKQGIFRVGFMMYIIQQS